MTDKVISFPKQKSWEEKYLDERHEFLTQHLKNITKGLHVCEICKKHYWNVHSKDFPTILAGSVLGHISFAQRYLLISCNFCCNVKHIFVNEAFSNRLLKFDTDFRDNNIHPSQRSSNDEIPG